MALSHIEKSGEMGGLTRPRAFTVDDGHGFVREDQIFDETISLLKIIPKAEILKEFRHNKYKLEKPHFTVLK